MTLPTHFGDPCIHCGTPHDEVERGPCKGDMAKAVPVRWRSLGVRWDNVEHFLILMSSGEFTERWDHIEFATPCNYLKDAKFDARLRRPR